jgi:hypothetical protein
MAGLDEGVKGASPIPGIVSSINWPVSKAIGSSGTILIVFIVGVSDITPVISALIYNLMHYTPIH